MLSNSKNEICAYWLRSLKEQTAIRTGKLRIIPGTEARDPDFKQYSSSDFNGDHLMFGGIGRQSNAIGKSMGERFCELLVKCCRDGLERKQHFSSSAGDSSAATTSKDFSTLRTAVDAVVWLGHGKACSAPMVRG